MGWLPSTVGPSFLATRRRASRPVRLIGCSVGDQLHMNRFNSSCDSILKVSHVLNNFKLILKLSIRFNFRVMRTMDSLPRF